MCPTTSVTASVLELSVLHYSFPSPACPFCPWCSMQKLYLVHRPQTQGHFCGPFATFVVLLLVVLLPSVTRAILGEELITSQSHTCRTVALPWSHIPNPKASFAKFILFMIYQNKCKNSSMEVHVYYFIIFVY